MFRREVTWNQQVPQVNIPLGSTIYRCVFDVPLTATFTTESEVTAKGIEH